MSEPLETFPAAATASPPATEGRADERYSTGRPSMRSERTCVEVVELSEPLMLTPWATCEAVPTRVCRGMACGIVDPASKRHKPACETKAKTRVLCEAASGGTRVFA